MKKYLLLISFLFSNFAFSATENPSSVDVQAVTIGQLSSLYFRELSKGDYVLCDAVINDQKLISVRSSSKVLDFAFYNNLLDLYGYQARKKGSVWYICSKDEVSPLDYGDAFMYKPQFRDVSYLVSLASPLIKGTFANRRQLNQMASNSAFGNQSQANANLANSTNPSASLPAGTAGTSNAISQNSSFSNTPNYNDDFVIFLGESKEKRKLAKLLEQLDTPTGEVILKGYVYEVGKNDSTVSGLDMFINIFKNVMPNVIAGTVAGAYVFKTVSLQYVSQVLSTQSNFKIITSPYTRVKSGSTARFVVGSDVPILGSIVTTGTGTSTQSVEYKSSGSLFEVTPKVHNQSVEVDLFQQISSFVKTTTGVNGSPTLNKRELRTSLNVGDSELLIIGGLNETNKNSVQSAPWGLPFISGTSSQFLETEIIVILEVKKI